MHFILPLDKDETPKLTMLSIPRIFSVPCSNKLLMCALKVTMFEINGLAILGDTQECQQGMGHIFGFFHIFCIVQTDDCFFPALFFVTNHK